MRTTKSLLIVSVIFGLIFLTAYVFGQQPVAQDANVSIANPTTNYGTRTTLPLRQNYYEAYLKFDVSALTSTVNLKLYGYINGTSPTNVPVTIYAVSNTSWTETTITWNSRPTAGAALATTIITNNVPRDYFWDVTSYVQSEKAAGRNIISLAVKADVTTSPYLTFNSKEASGNRPELLSIGGPIPTPTATPVPTGTPTPSPTSTPTPVPTPTVTPSPTPTPVPSGGALFYVATSGSDSNPGDLTRPFRTIAKGLTALHAGETLYIREGTYTGNVSPTLRSGTATARILVTNYPNERYVIKGLVRLTKPDYWTFNAFNVTWNTGSYTDHMIKMNGGTNWVIENSEIWGARSFADILVWGTPSNWTIRNNTIYDTFGGESNIFRSHNLYINTGLNAGPGLIERNLIFNATHGCNVKLDGAGGPNEGAANVTVRYNTLYNGVQPVLVGSGSKNNTVERNIIVKGIRPSTDTYLLRIYQLVGVNNIVRNNLGYDADKFCMDYDGGNYTCSSINGGGNVFPINPQFDFIGVSGFHPQNPAAQNYGRYAP